MRRLFLMGLCLLGTGSVYAGGIRTVFVDAENMGSIYLKMGQSTVLRFNEKPKKVVVGNSNYYSVEFIDNDLTIQPQGAVPTNLFVYGEHHTFGFNLKIGTARFDDLVNVRWKSKRMPRTLRRQQSFQKPKIKKVNQSFKLTKDFTFKILEVQQNKRLNSTIIDLVIENSGSRKVETSQFLIHLSRSKVALHGQQFAFEKDKLSPRSSSRLRVVVKPMQKTGFTVNAKFKGKSSKKIIRRRFL